MTAFYTRFNPMGVMKFAEVAENVKQLVENPPATDEFIFELIFNPDTTKRSEKECHSVTGRSPTSLRGVQMPDGLREAHHQLDLAVDRLYRSKPFTSAEERLEHLFKLYEEMTAKEKLI